MTTDTAVKERPILFSGAMVRAILAGTKTQTRRSVKPQPQTTWRIVEQEYGFQDEHALQEPFRCPYGTPGDRLWVKETHRWGGRGGDMLDGKGNEQWLYAADGHSRNNAKWRPSIFMSRAASRITLEIVSVRVERLQEISEQDAKAEGCDIECSYLGGRCNSSRCAADHYRKGYRKLWESINGPGSWVINPFVWVLEFKIANREEASK